MSAPRGAGNGSCVRIGIIGAGKIGATAARHFACAGHAVIISNSRGPASLVRLVDEINAAVGRDGVRAASVDDAALASEIVLLAVPWRVPEALPSPATVTGRIVIDAMNPYAADRTLIELGVSSSSEETARRLPGARLVKAFNSIWCEHLATRARTDLPLEERQAILVAGDDPRAKHAVMCLIEQIGFAPVDTGSLREGGRRQQPGTPLYDQVMTGREARERLVETAAAHGVGAPGDAGLARPGERRATASRRE